MQRNSTLVIAVIISLVVGSGGAYLFTSNQLTVLTKEKAELLVQIATVTSENNQLQNRVGSLSEDKTSLESQVSSINNDKTNLQSEIDSLTTENLYLTNSIEYIAETIDAMHSDKFEQGVEYNITAGTELTKYFIIDRYGIVWETVIDFSGTSVRVTYFYWYHGIRNYVIGFSSGLTYRNNPDLTYLGPQEYISGTISIDITPDWKGGTQLWIGYYTNTQFEQVRWSGNMYIDVELM